MKRALLVLALVCLAAAQPSPSLPAFRSTISQAGLNHIKDEVVPYLVSLIGNVQVPDVSGSRDHINYQVTGTVMSGFTLNVAGSTIAFDEATNSITVNIVDGAAHSHCNWHWSTYLSVHGSGTADVKMSAANVMVKLQLATTADGHPSIVVLNAAVNFGGFDVSISGSFFDAVYNLLISLMKNDIKSSVQAAVSQQIKDVIQTTANAQLANIPLVQSIDSTSEVDMSLEGGAKVVGTTVNTGHKAEFYRKGNHQEFPATPFPMPPTLDDGMLQVFIDQYVFNSAVAVYYGAGYNAVTLHDSDLPADVPFRLNTKTFETMWPEFYKAYPDLAMDAVLTATEAPVLDLGSDADVTVKGTVQLDVLQANGTAVKALVLTVEALGVADPKLSETTVILELEQLKVQSLAVAYAVVGGVDAEGVQEGINSIVAFAVIPLLKKKNPIRVDIPHVDGLTISSGTVVTQPKYIMASANIDYKPSFELMWPEPEQSEAEYRPEIFV